MFCRFCFDMFRDFGKTINVPVAYSTINSIANLLSAVKESLIQRELAIIELARAAFEKRNMERNSSSKDVQVAI